MRLFFKKSKESTKGGRRLQLMLGQNDYIFRRSRTIVGSLRPDTTSPPTTIDSQRLSHHELRAHFGRVLRLFLIVFMAIVVLGFVVSSYIVGFRVTTSQPLTQALDSAGYEASLLNYFADHPLERFAFMLNDAELSRYVKAVHSEVAVIAISHGWIGEGATVNLTFRRPLVTWQSNGQSVYVDSEGVAFQTNYLAKPIVAVTDRSGLPAETSGVVASSRFIRFIGRMVGALAAYHKGAVKEVIIPAAVHEVDLRLKGRGYLIRTNADRDPLQQAEDIANTLAYVDAHHIKPRYLDVRVAHKAYYK